MPLAKENAREFGTAGDRPKGRRSTSKKWSPREFAGMVVKDPIVQQRILKQAQAGTLPPRVLIELFHYYGGPPPSEPELPSPDPTSAAADAERRAQIARLSKEERLQLATLLEKLERAPAPAGPGGPAKPGHEAR
jgi:hypothetical protein